MENISSDADMTHFHRRDEVLDLMEKSGCDLPLSVRGYQWAIPFNSCTPPMDDQKGKFNPWTQFIGNYPP